MSHRLLIWSVLVLATGAVVLHTSMRTRAQQEQLALITREIRSEQERVRVLTAEWHSLKAPERLEALSRRHLKDLGPPHKTQLVSLADIPDRLPAASEDKVLLAQAPEIKPQAIVAPAPSKPATTKKPVVLAKAAAKAPEKIVEKIVEKIPEKVPDDAIGALIARKAQPSGDPIREIIEREQAPGVLWASLEGGQ